MKKTLITALIAGAITGTTLARDALACMPHRWEAPPLPAFVGDSPNAAIAHPISMKAFEDDGDRYWRAQYEIVARRGDRPQGQGHERIVIEWSCDTKTSDDDPCGAWVDHALPGFDAKGRVEAKYVQLELAHTNASAFDGVRLYDASHDGSQRLPDPPAPPVVYRGLETERA
jgi:hypothetical protein